jgi:DNA-directed RNA polymerase I, II, and III subunit RPABC2
MIERKDEFQNDSDIEEELESEEEDILSSDDESQEEKSDDETNLLENKMNEEDELVQEDEEDEDEEEDENPFQRLEHPTIHYHLEAIHPEIRSCNYQEIVALSKVIRDSTGKIIDPLHTTLPFLTKYEKARIIGTRAEQIELGAPPFVSVGDHIIQGRTIALMEFEQKTIPFIIARPIPNGGIEYWKVEDLEVLG